MEGGDALLKFGERKMNEVYKKLEKHWKGTRQSTYRMPLGDAVGWTLHQTDTDATPQQEDISDSGIFICAYAESMSNNDDYMNFTTDQIMRLRVKIALSMMNYTYLEKYFGE